MNASQSKSELAGSSLASLVMAFLLCGALFGSATQALASPYNRSGHWWERVPDPLFGMAYTPEPSDYKAQNVCPEPYKCKYFDTDFFNSDFSLLWGPSGRNDLATIKKLGMNFIALYDWSGGFCRNHTPFLDRAHIDMLRVAIPISDTKVMDAFNPVTRSDILSILYQAYSLREDGSGTPALNPAVSMWRIGNEVELHHIALANVTEVVKIILNFEADKHIPDNQKLVFTSDVDFGIQAPYPPGIGQLLKLQKAFSDAGLSNIWHTRFIASINTKNEAPFIENYIKNVFPKQGDFSEGSRLPLFFAEYGLNSKEACEYIRNTTHQKLNCDLIDDQNKAQAEYEKAEFQTGAALAQTPPTSHYFYGFAVFQWQDAFWKCPNEYVKGKSGCTESLFGIQTVGKQTNVGSIPGGPCGLQRTNYPVNALDPKPVFHEIPGTLQGKHLGAIKGHG